MNLSHTLYTLPGSIPRACVHSMIARRRKIGPPLRAGCVLVVSARSLEPRMIVSPRFGDLRS